MGLIAGWCLDKKQQVRRTPSKRRAVWKHMGYSTCIFFLSFFLVRCDKLFLSTLPSFCPSSLFVVGWVRCVRDVCLFFGWWWCCWLLCYCVEIMSIKVLVCGGTELGYPRSGIDQSKASNPGPTFRMQQHAYQGSGARG